MRLMLLLGRRIIGSTDSKQSRTITISKRKRILRNIREDRGGDCNIRHFICYGAYVISSVFTEAIQWVEVESLLSSKDHSIVTFPLRGNTLTRSRLTTIGRVAFWVPKFKSDRSRRLMTLNRNNIYTFTRDIREFIIIMCQTRTYSDVIENIVHIYTMHIYAFIIFDLLSNNYFIFRFINSFICQFLLVNIHCRFNILN